MVEHSQAREKFEFARDTANDEAIVAIAEGLRHLSKALETQIRNIESDVHAIKNRVNLL
ncbi:MAG TPA: hypothetical protein VKB47_05095 [Terracidiphilus sp.]|nr:hypothetical protein [Terracidiphilus sp.]